MQSGGMESTRKFLNPSCILGRNEFVLLWHRTGFLPGKTYDCLIELEKSNSLKGIMKDSTKDRMQGEVREIKGKVKETTGRITKNRKLEAEGTAEKVGGKVQKKVGDIEKVLED
jgi:uncharacterized protein YjbJ (UPF0337 family)